MGRRRPTSSRATVLVPFTKHTWREGASTQFVNSSSEALRFSSMVAVRMSRVDHPVLREGATYSESDSTLAEVKLRHDSCPTWRGTCTPGGHRGRPASARCAKPDARLSRMSARSRASTSTAATGAMSAMALPSAF